MSHQPRLIKDEGPDYTTNNTAKDAYRQRLRQHLQDPAFRQIEGFPLGDDEDILALSDPPYYTACPNPFLPEIIEQWQEERQQIRAELGLPDENRQSSIENRQSYHREPFAADVSEGKNDPIYNAHSYHTKVPHKAIMRYILHYTDPGDIVFDGFCGTGMTGVAAQLCGDRKAVEELGYYVDDQGNIYDRPVGQAFQLVPKQTEGLPQTESNNPFSRLGARKAVLNDLSPAATFIAYNYNTPVDVAAFEREARRILAEVEAELGWMYETWHPHCDDLNRVKARINYTVWSDVFVCPECGSEILFWDVAVEHDTGSVLRKFPCAVCSTLLTKTSVEKAWETSFDILLDKAVKTPKEALVAINYSVGKSRYQKQPDESDIELIQKVSQVQTGYGPLNAKMMFTDGVWGDQWRLGNHQHLTHVHQFFSSRNALVSTTLFEKIQKITDTSTRNKLLFLFQSISLSFTRLNRYLHNAYSQVNRYRSGTLYIPALRSEISPGYALLGKITRLSQVYKKSRIQIGNTIVSAVSSTHLTLPHNSIDYIFVDPPFGDNLPYSELNFIWEAWLKVFTNYKREAIVSKTRGKNLLHYQTLIEDCFKQFYQILKPSRWMTIEFHNSQNSVWNSIQEALLRAGFVIADVRTIDKKQGTFNQVATSGNAVKQDLVISAYKPHTEFEQRFLKEAGSEEGAWEFIRQHLAQLPIVVAKEGVIETLSERQDYLLFDRMVAFHIQRGASVPLSASQFYAGLRQRFIERDGMFFLPDQVPAYDKARLVAQSVAQLTLFVSDEKSSIQWLRQQLSPEFGGFPQTYQEIQPQFLRQLHQLPHESLPELSDLLEQNFLQDEAGRWYIPDPNKATDLEKLRQKALLREFNGYREGKKRLKQFRTEAVRAGFAHAWANREYATIVQVAERLPEAALQEDPDLLMYYDNASLLV